MHEPKTEKCPQCGYSEVVRLHVKGGIRPFCNICLGYVDLPQAAQMDDAPGINPMNREVKC
jgi:endogenous inhibitor of DNA gyrase (YacG/DUF329 family)